MSLKLLSKLKRSLNYPRLIFLLKDSCKKDLKQTILIIFYIRDVQGLGEKKLAKEMLQWLMINYPSKFQKILPFIPIFGRWDDLLYFFPNITRLSSLEYVNSNYLSNINEKNLQEIIKTQNKVVEFFCNTLKRDLENMIKAKNITLLAKWAPSEYSSKDNKYNLVETICNYMKISPRIYRKRYLTPLRKYLKIVERSMCAKKWDKINYDLIPSKARLNLHYAFIRNDNKRYLSHKFIRKQKTTPKYAHQIIYNYAYAIKINPVIEKQWDNFINNINNNFENLRVCVDTTSSMYIRKNNKKYLFNRFFLDIGISLALVLSHFTKTASNFSKIVTFEDNMPLIHKITSLNKLGPPSENKLSKIIKKFENFKIIIITTQKIDLNMYKNLSIINWIISDEPLQIIKEQNLTIVHGFSTIILKTLLNEQDISYDLILKNISKDSRYSIL